MKHAVMFYVGGLANYRAQNEMDADRTGMRQGRLRCRKRSSKLDP